MGSLQQETDSAATCFSTVRQAAAGSSGRLAWWGSAGVCWRVAVHCKEERLGRETRHFSLEASRAHGSWNRSNWLHMCATCAPHVRLPPTLLCNRNLSLSHQVLVHMVAAVLRMSAAVLHSWAVGRNGRRAGAGRSQAASMAVRITTQLIQQALVGTWDVAYPGGAPCAVAAVHGSTRAALRSPAAGSPAEQTRGGQ